MPGYEELLAANPEAFKAHEARVAADEKKRTDAAVALALADASKPKPATLSQLKAIVPDSMPGRGDFIIGLQEQNATETQAHAAVAAKLSEQLAATRTQLAEKDTADKGLGNAGKGAPALKLAGAAKPGDETYMGLVNAEADRLRAVDPKMSERDVMARAYTKISRERRDLLDAHQDQLAAEAVKRDQARKMSRTA